MSTDKPTGIIVTERAAKEVFSIMESEGLNKEACYLRVGVKGGGCAGFNYVLDITETIKEKDEVFENNKLRVVCDDKSLMYLNGTVIDFQDELMGRGFVFKNPNSTSSCGCGSSFSA